MPCIKCAYNHELHTANLRLDSTRAARKYRSMRHVPNFTGEAARAHDLGGQSTGCRFYGEAFESEGIMEILIWSVICGKHKQLRRVVARLCGAQDVTEQRDSKASCKHTSYTA
eukprot:353272-Chlamydomonas_euryale.AAC.2